MFNEFNHKNMRREDLGLPTNVKRGHDREIPRLNLANNFVLKKKLMILVSECPFREKSGEKPGSCCNQKEGIFRCRLYNIEQIRIHDCLVCQKNKAIKEKAEWITPFLELWQGSVSSSLSLEQVLQRLSGR